MGRTETLVDRYGEDFFKKIGAKGGKKSRGGGFSDPEVARKAGKKSKRKPVDRTNNLSV